MSKYIAVAAALAVVAIFFVKDTLSFPELNSFLTGSSSVGAEAWKVFEQYRTYALEHNLLGIKSLSHQISDTCANPETREECNSLMDSVYSLTQSWKQGDFTEIHFDEKQIVMLTPATADSLRLAFLFTRDETGAPKVLSVKWCLPESVEDKCVNTDPLTRDSDGDGWWDDVEAAFYSK